jgi:hypothetical protein
MLLRAKVARDQAYRRFQLATKEVDGLFASLDGQVFSLADEESLLESFLAAMDVWVETRADLESPEHKCVDCKSFLTLKRYCV